MPRELLRIGPRIAALPVIRGSGDFALEVRRATSLVSFSQAGHVKSWHFRQAVLQRMPVSGRWPPTA